MEKLDIPNSVGTSTQDSITGASKPHYLILDGLRGVAALMVIWFHIFEGFATSALDQKFNHGYLAVDFFFILSGFVIGYAYDDRWSSMSVGGFFKRRLIRLHPMVILAAVFGAVTFLLQGVLFGGLGSIFEGGVQWNGTHVALGPVLVSMLMAMFLIPCRPGGLGEVRGNGEMFPLNGPSWSLFFEYIANIMYALFLRRLSSRMLKVFVAVSGLGYAAFAVLNGSGAYSMGVGWTLGGLNFLGGLLRVTFAFSCGLLLSRNFKPLSFRGQLPTAGVAFWISAAAIVVLLSVPYISLNSDGADLQPHWLNGLYDALCTLVIFPLLVLLGASASASSASASSAPTSTVLTSSAPTSTVPTSGVQPVTVQSCGLNRICTLLGEVSYPLSVIHYPIMYLFYAWVWNNGLTFSQAWPVAVGIFVGAPILAYICLKVYDLPVRRWLSSRF